MRGHVVRTLVVALLVALGASGCQSSPDPGPTSSGGTPEAAAHGFPLTVTTKTAATTVESRPERVVTLGNPAFENTVAVGVEPVGATLSNSEDLPYLADYQDSPALAEELIDSSSGEVNFEAVAALQPDLIVAPDWPAYRDKKVMTRLQQIAPTLIFDTLSPGTDWRTGVTQVGKVLGKEAQAKKLVTEAEDAYARAADEATKGRTFSFGLFTRGQIMLGSGGYLLNLTGLEPAKDQKSVEKTRQPITYSTETLGEVKGDIVFLMPRSGADKQTMFEAPAWRGDLKERVIWLSAPQGEAVNNAGVLGKTWFAGELPELLHKVS